MQSRPEYRQDSVPVVVSKRIFVQCSPGRMVGHSRKSVEEDMKSFAKKVQRFLKSEDGPTAVEYAVMLALIIIVCLTAIRSIWTFAPPLRNNCRI